jgi:hypothetical protein
MIGNTTNNSNNNNNGNKTTSQQVNGSSALSNGSGQLMNGQKVSNQPSPKATSGSSSTRPATSWSSVVAASATRSQQSTHHQQQQQQQQPQQSQSNQQHKTANFEITLEDVSKLNVNNCQQPMVVVSGNNSAAGPTANNDKSSGASFNFDDSFSGSLHHTPASTPTPTPTPGVGAVAAPSVNPLPAKSSIKRSKMIYSCKFGEFGVNEGQFTEPSGVCINANNDIIVADTNSHRIQIFDSEGRFKFKFGECGKREGQLLYPNRVAVVKQTGDIVVTERSPTHQIQIYNQFGQFLRKFGANILQHPRGVCVDAKNRIIVVECKVMRVIIFDLLGNVLHKFNCSKYLEFPNGCCCSNDREEIFISDNRAHCIKVFNYEGEFMRQIGGEGITNYPIGVGINASGEVLVADNHNNFNLTVFTQDGEIITALESKVKHAQCFDVGLMDDGSIVLASKDYRIYVYKYNSQLNAGPTATNGSNGSGSGELVPTNGTNFMVNQTHSSSNSSSGSSSNSSSTSLLNSLSAFNNFN